MKQAVLALFLFALAGCSGSRPLPVYGRVPGFALTSQTGSEFNSRELDGKIWVADFFFISCTGPCPRMGAQMRWIRNQVRDVPQVRFVSFTVDPQRDNPARLAEYAKRFTTGPENWYFLTGPQLALHDLCRNAFKLGDVDGSLMHSTRFVLVDGRGRIRGYYTTEEQDVLSSLISDLRRLARER